MEPLSTLDFAVDLTGAQVDHVFSSLLCAAACNEQKKSDGYQR